MDTTPDGNGPSLAKIADYEYGNDFVNWTAATANPGAANPGTSFAAWIAASGLPAGERDPLGSAALSVSGGLQHREAEIPVTGKPKTFFRMAVAQP